MSERDENGYDTEQRQKARKLLAQGAAEYADSHEITAGGICTGYLMVMEITTATGAACLWLTGNGGSPDDEHTEGLHSWRVDGLARHVIRDLDDLNVSRD